MKSLIVCAPSGVTIEKIRDQLLFSGIGVEYQGDRVTVSHEGSLAWIEPDLEGELAREYESDELVLIERLIGNWNGFVIDYRAIEVADVVVVAMCEKWPCVVDDEDTFLGRGIDYLEHRREEGRDPH